MASASVSKTGGERKFPCRFDPYSYRVVSYCKRCNRPIRGIGKVFCTSFCSAKYNNEQRATRVVKTCGYEGCSNETLNPRFCSQQCHGRAQRGTRKSPQPERGPRNVGRRVYFTAEERAALLERQGGVCGVCGEVPKRPVIDHCHTTGQARGITCWSCNTAMGALGDTAEGVARAVAYLARFEATLTNGPLTQLAEDSPQEREVPGSSPGRATPS
jgi:hypothetical protein